jgi:hypothetical protein
LEESIDDRVREFVSLVERKYLTSATEYRPMDLARVTQYFTLDVIVGVAFGKHFGYLKSDSDVYNYIQMTEAAMPLVSIGKHSISIINIFFRVFACALDVLMSISVMSDI